MNRKERHDEFVSTQLLLRSAGRRVRRNYGSCGLRCSCSAPRHQRRRVPDARATPMWCASTLRPAMASSHGRWRVLYLRFSDVTGVAPAQASHGILAANFPAPTIELKEATVY